MYELVHSYERGLDSIGVSWSKECVPSSKAADNWYIHQKTRTFSSIDTMPSYESGGLA